MRPIQGGQNTMTKAIIFGAIYGLVVAWAITYIQMNP